MSASGALADIRSQHVFLTVPRFPPPFLHVEKGDAHFLDRSVVHRRLEIVAERLPARQQGAAPPPGLEQTQRGRLGDLERADDPFVEPFTA